MTEEEKRKLKNIRKVEVLLLLFFLAAIIINIVSSFIPPYIKGEAAITIDVDKNEIIYSKKPNKRMYPASMTKLITGMMLARNKDEESVLNYSLNAKKQVPYKIDLNNGERIKAKDAMDVMLLYSANDVAYCIAENISGDAFSFSKSTNEFLKSLGIKDTNFVSPTGLHDKNHYTTAYDMAQIARYTYNYSWVMNSIKKKTAVINTSRGNLKVENRNKIIGQMGCIGGKTGYTKEAGKCLIAFYERGGRRIIGVVMNSDEKALFKDMEKMVNWSYKQ